MFSLVLIEYNIVQFQNKLSLQLTIFLEMIFKYQSSFWGTHKFKKTISFIFSRSFFIICSNLDNNFLILSKEWKQYKRIFNWSLIITWIPTEMDTYKITIFCTCFLCVLYKLCWKNWKTKNRDENNVKPIFYLNVFLIMVCNVLI